MADDERPADAPTPDSEAETTPAPRPDAGPAPQGEAPPLSTSDHALHESALGRLMLKAGDVFRDYGNWILVALVAAAVLIWAYRLRQRSAAEADVAARQGIVALNDTVSAADNLRVLAPQFTADQLATRVSDLDQQLADMLAITRDTSPAFEAHALRLQGDYYWTLATIPAPLPATRPAGEYPQLQEKSDLLANAAAAYETVVNEYKDQQADVRAALFGLAAIHEEKGEFDAAAARYDQLLSQSNLPPVQRRVAEQRKRLLPRLSAQSRLAPPTTAPATPPTPPAGRGVPFNDLTLDSPEAPTADAPTTAPATRPAERDDGTLDSLLTRPDSPTPTTPTTPSAQPATRPATPQPETATPSTRPATQPSPEDFQFDK